MTIAVLAPADSWYVRDLARAAGTHDPVVPINWSDLTATLGTAEEQIAALPGASCRDVTPVGLLENCVAVLVRSMPPASLEKVVFRMDLLGRLVARGQTVVNPPRAIEAAVDKYLTTTRLQEAGLLVPETIVCQGVEQAMAAYETLGGDDVGKPLFGGEGRGIARVSDPSIALRVFKALVQIDAVLYLQRFVSHPGEDWRLLVVGDDVFGMRRSNPDDWRTNISRGASAAPLEVTPELAALARRAAAAVGAIVAGVDLLPGSDGQLYALEVNGVPGWRALARVTGVDVAARVVHCVRNFGR